MKVIRRDSRHHDVLKRMADHEWWQMTNNEIDFFNDLAEHGLVVRRAKTATTEKGQRVLESLKQQKQVHVDDM